MFLRKIKTPQGTTYLHLVESYREGQKVCQRTLLSLGKVGDGKFALLAEAIRRHTHWLTAEELSQKLDVKKTFILGPLLILQKLFEKLGINQVLEEILLLHPKINFDLKKILFTMVSARFVQAGSKLKLFEHWQRVFYPDIVVPNLKLHQLYRALDLLAKHKENIEKSLYWHGRDLFNREVDVVLYDLTTLRFESVRTDKGKLRQFGYSKEKRSDCTQVVFGLLVDKEGLPLGFEVYPGNTFEGKTVADIAGKMREKFQVRRFVFVGDRGLFSTDNLKAIRKGESEFIMGMKIGVLKNRHKEFYDKSRYKEVQGLSVYETEHKGDRLILTWSLKRAERDRKTREDILSKIEKKLKGKRLSMKSFVTNKNYKKYVCLDEGKKTPILNQEVIKEEERRDGFFGVVTNVKKMPASELVSNYKELWRIEDAFGELKGTLKARPVFHWTDQRIKGHLVMCFIAYLCEAYLTRELRKRGSFLKSVAVDKGSVPARALTVSEALRELREVRAVPVKVKEKTMWIRTDIEGNAARIFRAAGVQIPKKLLKVSEENES